jgi:hypothetical protein
VLCGVLLGVALLVLSSLPLGLGLWADYFAVSRQVGSLAFTGELAPWKHQTLLAFWTWVLDDPDAIRAAWLASAALAGVAVFASWGRTSRPTSLASPASPARLPRLPRLYAQAVLFVVAVNPYLFYYDGLLLAVPALVWALDPDRAADGRFRQACGALLAAIWIWQHVAMFARYDGCPPLIGPLCLAWLVLDAWDLRTTQRARPERVRATR